MSKDGWNVFQLPSDDWSRWVEEYFTQAAAMRFDGVGLLLPKLFSEGLSWSEIKAMARKYKSELDRHGLKYLADAATGGGHTAPTHDPPEHRWLIEQSVNIAENFLNVFGGHHVMSLNPPQRFPGYEGDEKKWLSVMADCTNKMGKELQRYGISLGVHNHCNTLVEKRREFDMFMGLTDPERVGLWIDVGHLAVANQDYLEIVEDHKNRIIGFDLKDIHSPGTVYPYWAGPIDSKAIWPETRPLGEGSLDLVGIFRIAAKAGLDVPVLVEQENSKGISDAKISKKFIDDKLKPLFE